jgi:hypothetical protein
MHDACHVSDAARADLEGKQLCRVRPQRRPAQTVRSIGKEDADQDAVGEALRFVGGIHWPIVNIDHYQKKKKQERKKDKIKKGKGKRRKKKEKKRK